MNEGVRHPDEQVEPGTDDVPEAPGLPGGAAQPDVLLVLVTPELEDVAVEDGGEEDGAEEDAEGGQVEGVEEREVPAGWLAESLPGVAQAVVVEAPPLPVQEGAGGEGGGEERRAAGHEEEEGAPLAGGEDGGGVADVDPAVDGDGDAQEPGDQGGGEGDGDADGAVEGGVESPVVEEAGPVEDVGDVGEAQEAVKSDKPVDGGGAGLGPDDGQDGEDEDEDNGAAKEPETGEPGGGEGEGNHPLVQALVNWREMFRGSSASKQRGEELLLLLLAVLIKILHAVMRLFITRLSHQKRKQINNQNM